MKTLLIVIITLLLKFSLFGQNIAASEVVNFNQKIRSIIKEGNASKFNDLISVNELKNKYIYDKEGKDFIEAALQSGNLGKNIITSCSENGATYEFVKSFTEGNKTFLLYRLTTSDMGLNYHELELCRENGIIKISDIFIYLSGENVSESLFNAYKSLMVEKNKMTNQEEAKAIKAMTIALPEIKKLSQAGEHQKAYEKLKALPPFLKNLRLMQLLNITIAQDLPDEKIYEKAIDDFRNNFPKAKNLDLLLIDGFILKKQYDNALASVNNLDKNLGIDPYLDFYRYLVSNLKNDTTNSLLFIEKVANAFPNKENIQLELLVNYKELLKKEDLKKAIQRFKANPLFDQAKLIEYGFE